MLEKIEKLKKIKMRLNVLKGVILLLACLIIGKFYLREALNSILFFKIQIFVMLKDSL